jgi:hypothetical protein
MIAANPEQFAAALTPDECLDVAFNIAAPIEDSPTESHIGTAATISAFAVKGAQTAAAQPRILGSSQKFDVGHLCVSVPRDSGK